MAGPHPPGEGRGRRFPATFVPPERNERKEKETPTEQEGKETHGMLAAMESYEAASSCTRRIHHIMVADCGTAAHHLFHHSAAAAEEVFLHVVSFFSISCASGASRRARDMHVNLICKPWAVLVDGSPPLDLYA